MNVYGTGRVTADAKVKEIGDKKTKVVEFAIAVNKKRKGEGKSDTSFFDVQAWGNGANNAEKFKKGDFVIVFGELRQDTWEKEGQKHSKVLINTFNTYKAESTVKEDEETAGE
jgi:single-strand DNA-binding protein